MRLNFRLNVILILIISAFIACQDKSLTHKSSVGIESQKDYSLIWHWEDEFGEEDKLKLKTWIAEVHENAEKVLGQFPFNLNIHFHQMPERGEPVPWAHTRRSGVQAVHFHVDPSFDLEAFRNDWTAQHEISHVALPFLGKKNSWFAEGFASYMQYQVMHQMDIFDKNELESKYKRKLEANMKYFKDQDSSFVTCCADLISKHNYPGMYWGGASYFVLMDAELNKHKQTGLNDLMKLYQQDCRNNDINLPDLLLSLDSLSNSGIATELYTMYTEGPASEVYKKVSPLIN